MISGILPHYAAPAVGLLLVFEVGGLHWLRYWNPQGKAAGQFAGARGHPVMVVVVCAGRDSETDFLYLGSCEL